MRVFLDNVQLPAALETMRQALAAEGLDRPLGRELVPVQEAHRRVLAEPVHGRLSSPAYHAAAMDGYAVRAADTAGASEVSPVRLIPGEAVVPVDTGAPLPPGCDAVIMLEEAVPDGEAISIMAAVPRWQHVRTVGEDAVAGELLFAPGHRLRPQDLGVLIATGVTAVPVWRRPRVAVIPSGSELVSLAELGQGTLQPGQIIESNSHVLKGLIGDWGGEPLGYRPVADDRDALAGAISRAVGDGADLVVVNAGSSAGSRDLTPRVARELGEVLIHGVAIRPGKPVLFALLRANGRVVPMLGIPGYPVSAWLTFTLFGRPHVLAWQGLTPAREDTEIATLTRRLPGTPGFTEFVRVRLGRVAGRTVAVPLSRGAGVLTSLTRAEGLLVLEPTVEGMDAGARTPVQLLVERDQLDGTVLVTGSHDLALDLLASHLRAAHPAFTLASSSVGSLAGLAALRRGEAHLAGVHLLDPATGDYNAPYVRRYGPDGRVLLVTLVLRRQGLLVAPGNPLGITGLADLRRPGVRYVNRQRGAGTRVLLDQEIGRLGIGAGEIDGYGREEYSHLAVAAAVAGGVADCGMGILAAARALGLGFVEVAIERYELAVPEVNLDHPGVRLVLEILATEAFAEAVRALGGYDLEQTGSKRWVEGGDGSGR
ncbi:MAG: molybdopterin biosynthesis protein [bacterium]|nr:molybdopterin biosynthesis protein [bacterium]